MIASVEEIDDDVPEVVDDEEIVLPPNKKVRLNIKNPHISHTCGRSTDSTNKPLIVENVLNIEQEMSDLVSSTAQKSYTLTPKEIAIDIHKQMQHKYQGNLTIRHC